MRACIQLHPCTRPSHLVMACTQQSFRRFSSVRQEGLSQNSHVVFSGESAFVNASNGLSIQPLCVGGFTKQKRPATSVAERSFTRTLHPSVKRGRARRKVFMIMSIFLF